MLHGRDATPSEVRFLAAHDAKPAPADAAGKLTLHVFGRTNNAYRWAGEADVFEAIEAVKKSYPVDDQRVVLRGFSMGGAGAWHLGLHHPALWSSVEAGAGFTETKKYAKLGDVPPYVDKALHIYDSVDYALNAFNVPIAGYGGEDDPQLQASTNIVEALKALGLHPQDRRPRHPRRGDRLPPRRRRQDRPQGRPRQRQAPERLPRRARQGRGRTSTPKRIRFVTYTVKYGRAAWLSVEQLKEHYRRAEVDAEIKGDRVDRPQGRERRRARRRPARGREDRLRRARSSRSKAPCKGLLPERLLPPRRRGRGGWRQLDYNESRAFEENADRGKRRGLQGPIDDAFTGPFLCVRGTGDALERRRPTAGPTARLDQFVKDWAVYFRGDVRVKNDTAGDRRGHRGHHLILFGDPGSNRLIARVLKGLPLTWTAHRVDARRRDLLRRRPTPPS